MTNTKWLLALACIFCVARSDKPTSCGPPLSEKCQCAKQLYESVLSYVVNCTDSGFSNSNILQDLPRQTEVIIFRGNNFSSLVRNVFGEKDVVPVNLHTIDLTDNNIIDIPGRAFHHVPNVKKLILNNNRIRLTANGPEHEHVHSRLFSNFWNLTELHLVNAFEDGSNEDFPNALFEVFSDSNLTKLTHLHLENNRIRSIESYTFCDIPELKELYLDGNDLTDLDFKILCLPHLKHISLKSNNINTLNHKTLNVLGSFPTRKQNLTVDLQCNRWICNSAANLNVTKWLTTTNMLVGKYSCSASNPGCSPEKLGLYASDLSVMAQILIALTVIVFCIVGVVFYFKGTQIRNKFNPLLDTVSHKIQYTTLRRREEPEVDV